MFCYLPLLFNLSFLAKFALVPIIFIYHRVPANLQFMGRAEAAVAQWRMRHSLRPACRTRALRYLISSFFCATKFFSSATYVLVVMCSCFSLDTTYFLYSFSSVASADVGWSGRIILCRKAKKKLSYPKIESAMENLQFT